MHLAKLYYLYKYSNKQVLHPEYFRPHVGNLQYHQAI